MSAPLELEDVAKVFGTGRVQVEAISGVTLQVSSGELIAIMGPSGSGKTTLLSLAGGLDHPTHGRVLVEGQDLATLSLAELARLRRRRIGYVFQQLNLIEGLSAVENTSLPLELDGMAKGPARRAASHGLQL